MRYNRSVTAKQALREMVDSMTDEEAENLLDYVNMLHDPDELTEEEFQEVMRAEAEVKSGKYITLEELKAKYDL